MLPRGTPLILAAAAVLLAVHACIRVGGIMSEAAAVFCAFALMIAGPMIVLAWLGSVSDTEEKRRARRRRLAHQKSEALIFERTLIELQPSAWPLHQHAALAEKKQVPGTLAPSVAAALTRRVMREGKRATRPILALWLAAVSALGLAGCGGVPPEAWAAVRPGMGTTELVSLVGGPDYIRSNGTAEVWQYCRDFRQNFLIIDEGRNARYYTAILIDRQTIKEVQPYPVLSDAGCYDFYRAEF